MSRLTRKINGEWDFDSLVGARQGGVVCHNCGEIVKLTYAQRAYGERYGLGFYYFCPECFQGDTKTALTCSIGGEGCLK